MKRKFLALLLAFVMVAGMLPMAALAADGDGSANAGFGTITAYDGGTVDGSGTANVTVTFNSSNTLRFTPSANNAGRQANHWWAGFHVVAPTGASAEAKYKSTMPWGGAAADKNWSDNGPDYQFWGTADQVYITTYGTTETEGAHKVLTYTYQFDWDADGTYEQTVKLQIVDGVQLNMDGVLAQVGSAYFGTSLADAMTKAGSNSTAKTVKLLNNVSEDAMAIAQQTVTLDLNGKTLTGNITVPQNATLTIQDGSSDKNGAVNGTISVTEGTLTITGGTFSSNPSQYVPDTHVATETDGKWVVGEKTEPDEATLSFGEATSTEKCFPAEVGGDAKTVADMGKFEFAQPDENNKVVVTGTANYMTQVGFNTAHTNEEAGHYLPIKITSKQEGKIYITNRSDGGKAGKEHTLTANTGYETLIWLDGKTNDYNGSAAASLGENTFTVKVSDDLIYTIDFSKVVLLPKAEKDEETGTVTVTPGETEVESIKDVLTSGNGVDIDSSVKDNAPIKVETSGTDKALTFTGKDGTSTTVADSTKAVLTTGLINVVTGNDTKADVKVESSAGSVTVPAENLSGVSKQVEISVAKVDTDTYTDSNLTQEVKGDNLTDEQKTAVKGFVTSATTGVVVEATSDVVGEDKPVTVVINGLASDKTYVVLCISDSEITSFGEYTGVTKITLTSKHLTGFVPVEKTHENKDALGKVAADAGKVNDSSESSVKAVWTAVNDSEGTYYGGKLNITGLNSSKTYLVRLDNGQVSGDKKPSACYVISGESSKTISCQPSMNLIIFEIADGKTVNSKPTQPDGSDVWSHIYYNKTGNDGTPVSELTA